ncbi:hypothetical protein BT63DRAFT_210492 [Microthyrium microscopicum]|uniref:Heterokaryon incompatibility domain-containing protein n=1 Tax=Microthyrium microscopicum TaxID=703497 RepID=A0A6A6UG07_9PEZI|nr:hypothetical protein BT63DRAFT_210492 [Microthyrium microscopicum]
MQIVTNMKGFPSKGDHGSEMDEMDWEATPEAGEDITRRHMNVATGSGMQLNAWSQVFVPLQETESSFEAIQINNTTRRIMETAVVGQKQERKWRKGTPRLTRNLIRRYKESSVAATPRHVQCAPKVENNPRGRPPTVENLDKNVRPMETPSSSQFELKTATQTEHQSQQQRPMQMPVWNSAPAISDFSTSRRPEEERKPIQAPLGWRANLERIEQTQQHRSMQTPMTNIAPAIATQAQTESWQHPRRMQGAMTNTFSALADFSTQNEEREQRSREDTIAMQPQQASWQPPRQMPPATTSIWSALQDFVEDDLEQDRRPIQAPLAMQQQQLQNWKAQRRMQSAMTNTFSASADFSERSSSPEPSPERRKMVQALALQQQAARFKASRLVAMGKDSPSKADTTENPGRRPMEHSYASHKQETGFAAHTLEEMGLNSPSSKDVSKNPDQRPADSYMAYKQQSIESAAPSPEEQSESVTVFRSKSPEHRLRASEITYGGLPGAFSLAKGPRRHIGASLDLDTNSSGFDTAIDKVIDEVKWPDANEFGATGKTPRPMDASLININNLVSFDVDRTQRLFSEDDLPEPFTKTESLAANSGQQPSYPEGTPQRKPMQPGFAQIQQQPQFSVPRTMDMPLVQPSEADRCPIFETPSLESWSMASDPRLSDQEQRRVAEFRLCYGEQQFRFSGPKAPFKPSVSSDVIDRNPAVKAPIEEDSADLVAESNLLTPDQQQTRATQLRLTQNSVAAQNYFETKRAEQPRPMELELVRKPNRLQSSIPRALKPDVSRVAPVLATQLQRDTWSFSEPEKIAEYLSQTAPAQHVHVPAPVTELSNLSIDSEKATLLPYQRQLRQLELTNKEAARRSFAYRQPTKPRSMESGLAIKDNQAEFESLQIQGESLDLAQLLPQTRPLQTVTANFARMEFSVSPEMLRATGGLHAMKYASVERSSHLEKRSFDILDVSDEAHKHLSSSVPSPTGEPPFKRPRSALDFRSQIEPTDSSTAKNEMEARFWEYIVANFPTSTKPKTFDASRNHGNPYKTLEHEDSIRILSIKPGTGPDIHCDLVETRLSCLSVDYEGLSYVWGNPGETEYLHFPTGSIKVTQNLCTALRHLRHSDKERRIWADAASINQGDVNERSHQVTLMRKIYMSASRVVLWLGPDTQNTARLAFSVVCSVASGGELNGKPLENAYFHGNDVSSADILDFPGKHGPPEAMNSRLWKPVQDLFGQSWFWRVWCIQEVALAKDAIAIWGSCTISWRYLGIAAARLRTSYLDVLDKNPMPGVFNAYFMYRISASQLTTGDLEPLRFNFPRLLALTRQFEATDPRDRVYGLLGLPTTDADAESGQLYVAPDYNKDTLQVYTDVASKAALDDSWGSLLSSVQTELVLDKTWPSWVPQWENVYTQMLAPAEGIPLLLPTDVSKKSGPRRVILSPKQPIATNPTLEVFAILVATVGDEINISTSLERDSSKLNSIFAMPLIRIWLDNPVDRLRLAWTLTAGKSWYGLPIDDTSSLRHLSDFYAFMKQLGINLSADQASLSADYSKFATAIFGTQGMEHAGDLESASWQRFTQSVRNVAHGRRLFLTQDRKMLGLGPEAMKEGDVIAIIEGALVPFVLRRESEGEDNGESSSHRFRVLGECYVCGVKLEAERAGRLPGLIHLI